MFTDNIKIITWFILKIWKAEEKLKEFKIMYQNASYICIYWYNKISWLTIKKYWCQQNSGGVSRDSYIFWIFFR